MDKNQADKAIRNGVVAACISGILTATFFLFAIFSNTDGDFALWNDPLIVFDAFLIFACAYGIYKKSKFAAVFLFCYFLLSLILLIIEREKITWIAVAIVFLYFYGKAIQGTFAFHRIEKSDNPDYKTTPKWIVFVATSFLILFMIMGGWGGMMMAGVLPSMAVQTGDQISQSDKEMLISNGIINEYDEVEYFYSDGVVSVLEGGSILIDDRVILYFQNENEETEVYEIYFYEVTSVELIESGNALNDSIYQINSYDPDVWMQISLSVENSGDVKFIEALREGVKKSHL